MVTYLCEAVVKTRTFDAEVLSTCSKPSRSTREGTEREGSVPGQV